MKAFQIQTAEYKGITFLIKGYDDISAKLDDQIVATQTMNASPYMKNPRAKKEGKDWEKKLQDISDLLEEMLKTQRNWMQLEPIF